MNNIKKIIIYIINYLIIISELIFLWIDYLELTGQLFNYSSSSPSSLLPSSKEQ